MDTPGQRVEQESHKLLYLSKKNQKTKQNVFKLEKCFSGKVIN